MKKVLTILCVGVLLAGCGGSGSGESAKVRETKTCTLEVMGIAMDMGVSGQDDVIDQVEMKMTMPESMTKGVDLDNLTDAQKDALEKQVLTQQGLEQGEGIEVKTDVTDGKIAVTVILDMAKASDKAKEALGLQNAGEQKISDFVKQMEDGGATCK